MTNTKSLEDMVVAQHLTTVLAILSGHGTSSLLMDKERITCAVEGLANYTNEAIERDLFEDVAVENAISTLSSLNEATKDATIHAMNNGIIQWWNPFTLTIEFKDGPLVIKSQER